MLLIAHAIFAEDTNQKINLEDIERDNLISERRSQTKEVLEGQHTQHLRPPNIQASNSYEVRNCILIFVSAKIILFLLQIQHETDEVSTNDITYTQQEAIPENQQYETHQRSNVQYVTIEPEQYQEEKGNQSTDYLVKENR